MDELIEEFVNEKVWAVVGANDQPRKFGNMIYRDMKQAGYTVYGVNPNCSEVDGDRTFPTLADLPVKPAVVDIVVPPVVAEAIVKQCASLGIERVWLQPGAESQAAIDYCRQHNVKVIYDDCCMVRKRRW